MQIRFLTQQIILATKTNTHPESAPPENAALERRAAPLVLPLALLVARWRGAAAAMDDSPPDVNSSVLRRRSGVFVVDDVDAAIMATTSAAPSEVNGKLRMCSSTRNTAQKG